MEVDLRALLPCHGLDKLWGWKWVYIGMFVMNDGALRAVKKLYVCLYAARDTNDLSSQVKYETHKLLNTSIWQLVRWCTSALCSSSSNICSRGLSFCGTANAQLKNSPDTRSTSFAAPTSLKVTGRLLTRSQFVRTWALYIKI
jgi:hypothetical protein